MCFDSIRKCENYFHEKCVYFACSVLGVLNLGLWASDSIGKGRFPVFTISMYRAYKPEVWSFIVKIILTLTIFYRFHTGLDFLEFYWKLKPKEKPEYSKKALNIIESLEHILEFKYKLENTYVRQSFG